jgi:hypothetical protein
LIDDDFVGVTFAPFGGSTSNFAVDTTDPQQGSASIRFDIPSTGYAGGALVLEDVDGVDVSQYNAVTFYARVDAGAHTLDVVGFGNDAVTTDFAVERPAVALTTTWQRVILPIPAPASTSFRGAFHFAEGSGEGAYALFIDDVRYTTLETGVITNPRPAIATVEVTRAVGETIAVAGQAATYAVVDHDGAIPVDITLSPVSPRYFGYSVDDSSIAGVDDVGVVTARAAGTAVVTASLNGVAAAGALTVNVASTVAVPTDLAPAPSYASDAAIALFSSHYTPVVVDTFLAGYSAADLIDFAVLGRTVKKYTLRNFAGIETVTNTIDATTAGMTAFSMAVWTPDVTSLLVKVVDFGADGVYSPASDGGDDVEIIKTIAITTPNAWTTIEVPFSDNAAFQGHHVAQIILDGGSVAGNTLYVDDMLFHE